MVTFNKIIEFYLYTNCSNYTNFTDFNDKSNHFKMILK